MSSHDFTRETPGREAEPSFDASTLSSPAAPPPSPYEGATESFALDPDADTEWVAQSRRGVRIAIPLAGLVAALLVAAGFFAGATLEKNHRGATSGAAALASSFRSARLASSTAATGTSGAGTAFPLASGSSAATTGTVSIVDGNTVYVLTSSGSLVKVELTSSTTITRNAKVEQVDLRPGDTVTVEGASTDGRVVASSLSATAPGVTTTSGFAGFGGAGGTFTRAAASSSTSTTTSTTTRG
jgi:hypothetical protein